MREDTTDPEIHNLLRQAQAGDEPLRKAAWDEFESLEAYVDWCDRWLAEVARVLAPHGSAYACASGRGCGISTRSARW